MVGDSAFTGIGSLVADAVEHDNLQRILHRVVEPPYLLLDSRGNIRLADSSLSKAV